MTFRTNILRMFICHHYLKCQTCIELHFYETKLHELNLSIGHNVKHAMNYIFMKPNSINCICQIAIMSNM